MSPCLTPWLEETFATQLLLGHHWQQQRVEQKEAGIKLEKETVWKGLYHDNGSCLDITNDFEHDGKHILYIIQLSPPILCDSNHHIRAHLTSQCLTHLRTGWPDWELNQAHLRTAIAVRKYSIRHTAYGPPRERLRLILHTVDWLPETATQIRGFNPRVLKSLWSEDIAIAIHKLQQLRMRSEHRCLNTGSVSNTAAVVMAGTDNGYADSQPLTQLPLGTQPGHSRRIQVAQSNKSMPIREESARVDHSSSKPVPINAVDPKLASLLSLLNKATGPSKPVTSVAAPLEVDSASKAQSRDTVLLSTERPFTQLPLRVDHEPLRQDTLDIHPTIASRHDQGSRRTSSKSAVRESVHATNAEAKQSRLQELASQCSWLKDFEFSHEAFKVDKRQLSLLQREESWHKPPPGRNFPAGNIPIEILQIMYRLADENAASGAAPDSDDAMDEDATPESVLETTEPTQVDPTPSSQVSWSPSPQPPQLPARIANELPPDSSFEPREKTTSHGEQEADLFNMSHMDQAATVTALQDESHISSSPPAPFSAYSDDDMDMEMEAYIPQALGEDTSVPPQAPSTFLSPTVKPVVQVKETPYTKKRTVHSLTQPATSSGKTSSTGTNKPHSSTSIIYGTYNDPRPTDSASTYHKISSTAPAPVEKGAAPSSFKAQLAEHHFSEQDRIMDQLSPHSSHPSRSLHSSLSASPGQPAISTHMGSVRDSVALLAHTKRKHEKSPSKKSGRHVKRRIKIVGFGSNDPSTIDPTVALRRDRDEALQRFREQRKSSAAQEKSQQGRNQVEARHDEVASTRAPDPPSHNQAGSAMSPRHMSLYEDSPFRDPESGTALPSETSRTPSVTTVNEAINDKRSDQKDQCSRPPESTPDTVLATFKSTYPGYSGDAKHFATQCFKIHALEVEDRMVPRWQWDDYIIRNRSAEWKNFALECLERGEEPPEYIRYYKDHIQNTLYRQSVVADKQTLVRALKELDVAMPEVRQNSNRPRPPETERTQVVKKKSRSSLPNAFDTHKRPVAHAMDTDRKRPRVSLPVGSHINATPSIKSRQTASHSPIPRLHGRQPSPSSSKPPGHLNRSVIASPSIVRKTFDKSKSTGDPFQDFLDAQKRMTSWTGSKEFDPKKPWPQNLAIRPSIDDALPRRKVDVLKWKDEL